MRVSGLPHLQEVSSEVRNSIQKTGTVDWPGDHRDTAPHPPGTHKALERVSDEVSETAPPQEGKLGLRQDS